VGKDEKGQYARWGKSGKKYRFKTKRGESGARAKAAKQGRAVRASGWRGK